MIPGSFYLFVIFHQTRWAGVFLQSPIQAGEIIIFLGLSYITGIIFDYLAVILWYRCFAPKNLHLTELERLKQDNPNLYIGFSEKQWPVLMSYTALHGKENNHVDRYATQKIMLRNISFGLIILSCIHLVLFFTNRYFILDLIVCLIALFFSLIAGKSAQKFDHWMVSKIFQNFIASAIDPKNFVKVKPETKKKTKEDCKLCDVRIEWGWW
jgi:hypothetical protein